MKPHICKWCGQWICNLPNHMLYFTGYGKTPSDAFSHWHLLFSTGGRCK